MDLLSCTRLRAGLQQAGFFLRSPVASGADGTRRGLEGQANGTGDGGFSQYADVRVGEPRPDRSDRARRYVLVLCQQAARKHHRQPWRPPSRTCTAEMAAARANAVRSAISSPKGVD